MVCEETNIEGKQRFAIICANDAKKTRTSKVEPRFKEAQTSLGKRVETRWKGVEAFQTSLDILSSSEVTP